MTPNSMVRKLRDKEGGFTLVELMVVVMIIAILMAIAIPTFLNSRKRAQDSAARSNVRNGLAAAQSVYSETQKYVDVTVEKLTAEEPSLHFVASDAPSDAPKTISFLAAESGDTIYLTSLSDSGKCFALRHSVAAGATGGTFQAELTTCTADAASADAVTYTAL
jgi:type IV pilus assembly protein PilA